MKMLSPRFHMLKVEVLNFSTGFIALLLLIFQRCGSKSFYDLGNTSSNPSIFNFKDEKDAGNKVRNGI